MDLFLLQLHRKIWSDILINRYYFPTIKHDTVLYINFDTLNIVIYDPYH